MNMPAFNINNIAKAASSTLNAHVVTMTSARWQSAFNLFENDSAVFQMLDARFPLQHRSHSEVKQYVVYYRHIMAFFADGTHCGFEHSKQFVAYNGCKEQPSSILLQEDNLHVELMFNRGSKRGNTSMAGIEDVQIEFPTARQFVTPDGLDYTV